jgi:hypothetical protein
MPVCPINLSTAYLTGFKVLKREGAVIDLG